MADRLVVIYHANCYDGFGAAWVLRKFLSPGTATYLPLSYGDPLPELAGCRWLTIADFSFSRAIMETLPDQVDSVMVFDHHKTAQAACEGLPFCKFDMLRSGAGLVWDFFFEGEPRPKLIDYVEDRDLWSWKLPESRVISSWISSFPREFPVWDSLAEALDHDFDPCVTAGKAIERYYHQKIQEITKESRMINIAGYDVPAVNCPYSFGSDAANELCQRYPDAPFAAYYFERADGEQQWGLRSLGFDVSEVAKQFGGGGHPRAAGFVKGKVTG